MEEKEILRDLVIDSLNLSRKLIRESTELKLNKNTVYQSCINDYCMKQYKLFKYVKNMDCTTLDDLKLRRYILNIARSYLIILIYKKFLHLKIFLIKQEDALEMLDIKSLQLISNYICFQ